VSRLHTPPHNEIVSAPVISTRSITARSKMNSIAETKNNASRDIRLTRTIVVTNSISNSSPRPIVASLHRGFCKCEPGLQVHSIAPERVPARR
jgi:hypothetical protein